MHFFPQGLPMPLLSERKIAVILVYVLNTIAENLSQINFRPTFEVEKPRVADSKDKNLLSQSALFSTGLGLFSGQLPPCWTHKLYQ